MKLIYLDFDGVICTNRACHAIGETGMNTYLDPTACKLVERLIVECDAKVVISSDWRLKHSKTEIFNMLKSGGHHIIANNLHTRWATPDLLRDPKPSSRGKEIELSLAEIEAHDSVSNYVILDDVHDFMNYQEKNVVLCDQDDGIGFRDFCKAQNLLITKDHKA